MRPSDEGCGPVIASDRIPYLEMTSVGSYSSSRRDKGGKRKREDPEVQCPIHIDFPILLILTIPYIDTFL